VGESGLPLGGRRVVRRSTTAELGPTSAFVLAWKAREEVRIAFVYRLDPPFERRMNPLRQANQVRGRRAKLKQDLREGTVRLEQILASGGADYLASAEVFDLLVAVPKIGPVKARRRLTTARISPGQTVGELSERQRAHLIELLSH
jgi:S13-like protein